MKRYIVNFKGDGHIIFHGEYTNYHTIEINLSAESLGHPGNNLFTEGETKTFELAVNLSVSRDNGYGEVAGDSYFNLSYAITTHNGEIDLQVKPFTFSPYALEWKIWEYDDNDSEDCVDILAKEALDIDNDWNFNADGIKQCLLKYITIEEVEDIEDIEY